MSDEKTTTRPLPLIAGLDSGPFKMTASAMAGETRVVRPVAKS